MGNPFHKMAMKTKTPRRRVGSNPAVKMPISHRSNVPVSNQLFERYDKQIRVPVLLVVSVLEISIYQADLLLKIQTMWRCPLHIIWNSIEIRVDLGRTVLLIRLNGLDKYGSVLLRKG